MELLMPKLDESVAEVTISSWERGEGESIRRGETLLVVNTDKAEVEIPAPESGMLMKIFVAPGTTVPAGTPIGLFQTVTEASAQK